MKKYGHKYTPQEIEGFRRQFACMNFFEISSELYGLHFNYMVIPQDMNKEIPYFVASYSSNKPEAYLICVSDSIKPEFRRYVAFHEFFEFVAVQEPVKKKACCSALRMELNVAPAVDLQEYASMRCDFFKNLIDYAGKHKESFDESDIDGFRSSLSLLEKIVK